MATNIYVLGHRKINSIYNFGSGKGMREDLIFGVFFVAVFYSSNLITFCVFMCMCVWVFCLLAFVLVSPLQKLKAEIILRFRMEKMVDILF